MDRNNIELLISIPESSTLCIVAPQTYNELIKILSGQAGADSSLFNVMHDRNGRLVKIIDDKTYNSIINRAILAGKSELNFTISFERNTMATNSISSSRNSYSSISYQASELSLSLSEISSPNIDIKFTIQCRIFNSLKPFDFISFKISSNAN